MALQVHEGRPSVPNASRRVLWFSASHRWDDPHEKWWCEQIFREGSHLAHARWCDEPFWRMYACKCVEENSTAKGKANREPLRALPAVRFRAKAGVLFEWLRDSVRREICKAFMGRLRYCPIKQVVDAASKMRNTNENPAFIAATA